MLLSVNPQNFEVQAIAFLLYSLYLTYTTSASPTSESSVPPSSTPSPTSEPTSLGKENTKNDLNYYFVVSVVIATFFCIMAIYLQRRRRLRLIHAKGNIEDPICTSRTGAFVTATPDVPAAYEYRVHERDEIIYEGLNERGEAPPPYVPYPKLSNARETSELVDDILPRSLAHENPTTISNPGSISLPVYDEVTSHTNNHNPGDIGLARPVPLVTG